MQDGHVFVLRDHSLVAPAPEVVEIALLLALVVVVWTHQIFLLAFDCVVMRTVTSSKCSLVDHVDRRGLQICRPACN